MTSYPIPSSEWTREYFNLSRAFDAQLQVRGISWGSGPELQPPGESKLQVKTDLSYLGGEDQLFRVLFLYLITVWFRIKSPATAFESLALDFRDTSSVAVGDGLMLHNVGGISETNEERPLIYVLKSYKCMLEYGELLTSS